MIANNMNFLNIWRPFFSDGILKQIGCDLPLYREFRYGAIGSWG
jgi:hypothetical protein